MDIERIVLIGFSGTGKSTIARLLAQRLDWTAIDIDRAIEIVAGKRIPEIFADDGEPTFRSIEREVLLNALDGDRAVIATGGGAVVPEDAWTPEILRAPGTLTVALDSSPDVILRRLTDQQALLGETIERPLLAGPDPLARIGEVKSARQAAYDRADITLVTDAMSVADVVDHLAALVADSPRPDVQLNAPGGSSRIYVRRGISDRAGEYVRQEWPRARTAFLVTDEHVGAAHGERIRQSLEASRLAARMIVVPPGESSKSWNSAGDLISQMLDSGIQRNDVVVALGGGMIGDLAGFAAAIVLRGVGVVQMPTSLLAMVDSSVGGKTGINHETGKNLIGAFYQPPLVLVDPQMLHSLPEREFTQGFAEVVKHAVIQPSTPDRYRPDLFALLQRNRRNLNNLHEPAMTYLIKRNIAIKAAVVEADEREASLRAILNYGHTIGHAIEASGYRYLHGEAVSVGIHAANRIARLEGRISDQRESQIAHLLADFGLPAVAEFEPATVKAMMLSDKKSRGGTQTWVLARESGGVDLVTGIAESTIDQALAHVRAN